MSTGEDFSSEVLIHAPTGRDGELACRVLGDFDLVAVPCGSIEELGGRLQRGAGAVLLAEEALNDSCLDLVNGHLDQQPAWSDLPLIVFTSRTDTEQIHQRFSEIANLTVLERPMRMGILVSVVRSALRSRRRQFETRRLLERLQETDRRKDEFLAMLGHELRNPLGAIRTAAAMLDDLEPYQRRSVEVIERQCSNLAHILDDLLDVSRVLSGKIALRKSKFDLVELVRRVVDGSREASQSIVADLPRHRLIIEGDAVRIEQVVSNLLSNAIKYTHDDGSVRVSVRREGGEAVVQVGDTGIGLDPGHLGRIFEPFVQADNSLDRARGGLGLGLPLVRGLVQLHGGRVSAASDGLQKGSEFTVRLPADSSGAAPSGDSTPPTDSSRSSGRVLVVDDNEDLLELMEALLTRWGYEVDIADNGHEAVQKIVDQRPDVVLLDIGLPQLDGYEVARKVRERLGDATPLLVAVTGYGQPRDKEQARAAGFDHHFVKPVEPTTLLALVRQELADDEQS